MPSESTSTRRDAHPPSGTPLDTETVAASRTPEELLSAVAQGDERAFEGLYDRVAPVVLGMVRGVVRDPAQSEEVAQEVFLELWRTATRYRPDRGGAVGWVLMMAHRRAVDRVRSAQARTLRERAATATFSRDRPYDDVLETVLANAEGQQVRDCLRELTDLERESILLAYYQAQTYHQVARTLSVPIGTVKSRMRAGLGRLRACLTRRPDRDPDTDPDTDPEPGSARRDPKGPGRPRKPGPRVSGYAEPPPSVRGQAAGQGGGAMSLDRREHLQSLLAVHDGAVALLGGVCDLCVSELAVSGARVRVLGAVSADGGGAMVYASDALGERLDDLVATVGAGPCVDAFERSHPVLIADLAAEHDRWPGFTADAVSAGVAAIFSFPLHLGAVRLGVLELHRTTPGPLSSAHLTDAFLLADAATDILLNDLHGVAPMTLPALVDIQAEVHQATGFVAVDLGVSLEDGLLRIRGYAFAHQRTLAEVAKDIVERRLRLDQGEQ